MFADSLLDSHWANRSHRGWTTLASFTLQALAVAILLTLPLLYTEGLPKLRSTVITAPTGSPPGQRAPAGHHAAGNPARPIISLHGITAPPRIPVGVNQGPDPAPDIDACEACEPFSQGPIGAADPIPTSIGSGPAPIARPVLRPPAPAVRLSRMMEGNLIHRVEPPYPPLARSARVQGLVILRAIISKTGTIENVQVVSGHPMLVKAARDAVSQWQYRPYVLNGEPVEVETQVTVNFTLSGG